MSFYDLSINDPSGNPINMSDFEGKAVLVVNTATKCGLTPQFDGLESLHQKYKDKGLVILGFPCNQFLSQSPESNETVVDVCRINHGVTFQLTEKIDVNGGDAHPIFVYLKKELGGMLGSTIKWNFTKFLITPDGKPFKRFSPKTEPEELENDIVKLLSLVENN
ncbi:Glutathione peroxidase [Nymphon striatum]|nr:Glutathione peroxidase [Nymphon striatum]